jgi:hypothetical protein
MPVESIFFAVVNGQAFDLLLWFDARAAELVVSACG